tara:strand:- start:717 stop:941 length:225 start_codon:yes stop_codon:yes gene_type:complete
MLSIEECRKHLGEKGEQMTDEEVVEVKESLYGLAELADEKGLTRKMSLKPPYGGILFFIIRCIQHVSLGVIWKN